MVDLSFIDPEF